MKFARSILVGGWSVGAWYHSNFLNTEDGWTEAANGAVAVVISQSHSSRQTSRLDFVFVRARAVICDPGGIGGD